MRTIFAVFFAFVAGCSTTHDEQIENHVERCPVLEIGAGEPISNQELQRLADLTKPSRLVELTGNEARFLLSFMESVQTRQRDEFEEEMAGFAPRHGQESEPRVDAKKLWLQLR